MMKRFLVRNIFDRWQVCIEAVVACSTFDQRVPRGSFRSILRKGKGVFECIHVTFTI